mmetsp:Transcript_48401/g.86031  ORF Transcript_48401/g.86031 Transcript_48401/m.86031 type:complete len:110 (+) Transcript_48401:2-331(+)
MRNSHPAPNSFMRGAAGSTAITVVCGIAVGAPRVLPTATTAGGGAMSAGVPTGAATILPATFAARLLQQEAPALQLESYERDAQQEDMTLYCKSMGHTTPHQQFRMIKP